MARKRKLDASGMAPPETPDAETPGMGGMWGGTALNMLKQRLSDTQQDIANGIMAGTLALELEPQQILDEVGSDRAGGWENDPEFHALVENIKRRGQTQAVRVRPKHNGWQPNADDPLLVDPGIAFVIQSGRRRLAACKVLGQKVRAVISTDMGDRALADLEERFHENTMRKNLNGFEELLSVGVIADALGDLSQSEIAMRLNVSQNDVSLGRSCVEMHAEIMAHIDTANTPKRAYREIIPRLRAGKADPKPAKTKSVPTRARAGVVDVTVKPAQGGFSVALKTAKTVDQEWLAKAIAELVNDSD